MKRKFVGLFLVVLTAFMFIGCSAQQPKKTIDLNGSWDINDPVAESEGIVMFNLYITDNIINATLQSNQGDLINVIGTFEMDGNDMIITRFDEHEGEQLVYTLEPKNENEITVVFQNGASIDVKRSEQEPEYTFEN